MRADARLIALSIVVAGALAGVGVYASRAPIGVAAAPAASVECPPVASDVEVPSGREARVPPPTSTPTPREGAARVPEIPRRDAEADRALQRQLDAARPLLTKKCWNRADGGASVRVRAMFEAGVQRHVSVEGSEDHPDLAECVRGALPRLTSQASSTVAASGTVTLP